MSKEPQTAQDRSNRNPLLGYVQLGAIVAAIIVAVYFAQAPDRGADAGLGLGSAPRPLVSVIDPLPTDSGTAG